MFVFDPVPPTKREMEEQMKFIWWCIKDAAKEWWKPTLITYIILYGISYLAGGLM